MQPHDDENDVAAWVDVNYLTVTKDLVGCRTKSSPRRKLLTSSDLSRLNRELRSGEKAILVGVP